MSDKNVRGVDEITRNLSKFSKESVKKIQVVSDIVAKQVVDYAKDNHPYTDRTTNLTQSIEQGEVVITDKKVEVEVVARQPYASYVEFGTARAKASPFLWPAVIKHQRIFASKIKQIFKG